jgi:lysophospholipase L1-like esterase
MGAEPSPATPKPAGKRRLILLVAVGLLVVAGAGAYRYFRLSLPVGEGPAGPAVSRESFDKPWTERRVLLLGLGDSVTAGYGARRGYSYFDRLVANPPDEFADMRGLNLKAALPGLTVRNMAVSGSTSLEHLAQLRKRLEKQPADVLGVVVMTTGGNDIIHNYGSTSPREGAMYGATLDQAGPWIANFERRLNDMIDALDERFPGGCQIFLADIYDPTDGAGDASGAGLPRWPDALAVLGAYNDVIRRCCGARPNVHLVPMHDAFLGHGIHCRQPWQKHYRSEDPHYWYYTNLEDPNERGYDAIRRLFLIEMARVIPNFSRQGAKLARRSLGEGGSAKNSREYVSVCLR